MRGKTRVAGWLVALAMGSMAHSQMIDVAFGNSDPVPTGAAYWGSVGDQWNEVNPAVNSIPSLIDTQGNATGASMIPDVGIDDAVVESVVTGTQPDPALTNFYLRSTYSQGIDMWLMNLAPDQKYNMVLYLASDDAVNGDRAVNAWTGPSPLKVTGDPASSFLDGTNIAVTSFVTNGAGFASILLLPESPFQGEIDLNGFQIQAVPEPTPALILGFGMLGLLVRRRKR